MDLFALNRELRWTVFGAGIAGAAVIPLTVAIFLTIFSIPMLVENPNFTFIKAGHAVYEVLEEITISNWPVMAKFGGGFVFFAYAIAFHKLNDERKSQRGGAL